MADEQPLYNTATDNTQPEAPRLNPSNGMSNFTQPTKKMPNISDPEDWRKAIYREAVELKKQELTQKKVSQPVKKPVAMVKSKSRLSKFMGFGGLKRAKSSRPVADQIKIMRLQNMLEKKRLQNQIERFKIQKKVQLMQKKGMLKSVIQQPIRIPQLMYPAYSTPELNADIDSAFNADMNGAGDFWGNENFYGGEEFYSEDYYDKELNLSPWEHLNIRPRAGVSPLLW